MSKLLQYNGKEWIEIGRNGTDGKTPKAGVDFPLPKNGLDGKDGKDGKSIVGDKGDKPDHKWEGTKLMFEKPNGKWGKAVDLKGKDGKSSSSIFGGGLFSVAHDDTLSGDGTLNNPLSVQSAGASTFTSLTDVPSSYVGQGTKFVRVNGAETALEFATVSGGGDALTSAPLSQFAATTSLQLKGVISDETGSGALVFADTPTLVTPVLGVATATSINKVAITAPATSATLTIANGKTLTASNTITFTATDGSTLAIGAGGTLGSAAYTASSAYEVPLTFSTGLTRSTNTITVNTTQNIAKLSNLTSNGFVKTSGGDGTLSVDTNTYLTSLTGAVLTDQTVGQTIGATGARLTKLWATDITVTNAISGSITGNAATVTNATLTTALTVNTGTLTLTANAANNSVLTIGAGAVSVSGTNTGDQTSVTGNAGTATALQNARTIGGVSFDGTGNITVASATGGFTVSGGNLALGTNSLTLTGSIAATGARVTKGWFTDIESTNAPTVSGAAVYYTGGTDVALADGGTGASLSDPNADRIMFWDDSAGAVTWLTAGTGLTITGTTITASGSGTVTNTGGNLTDNAVVLGAGTVDTKVVAGITTDGTSVLNLGVNATTIGKVKMFGNTSGDVTIQPAAVAGTATVLTLPATTGTLVHSIANANGISASNSSGVLTVTLGAITPTTVNGLTITTSTGTLTIANSKTATINNSITFSGTDSTTMTFPSTSATLARTDAANTFTGASTASAWVLTSPTITTKISPTTDDGAPLGDTTHNWSDLFLASGAVLNFANGNSVITHSSGVLEVTTGDLRVTTAGTNSASVVTVGGTQTLTNKTLTSPTLTTPSAFTTGGTITLAENTTIALDPAGSADGKYTGITVAGTAGYTQAFGDLVYLDPTDSRWEAADANSASGADGDARGLLGMVVVAGTDGNACTILLHGIIRADAKFPSFTINNPIYASETAGSVTQTQPTTTDVVIRVVGFALTADEMFLNPSSDYTTHT
jgi:hypothetical protein